MVPFGEFTAILASHFMAITARKKSRSHQRGAKNWVKGGYHGGIQLIWGNCEWADAPGMRGQEGTGRCYTRRTVRWATGILASNGKADMASSKLRYWSWFPRVFVHPESYFLHRGIHESWDKDIFLIYTYLCYMYPKYTFVCHSRHKPLSTVLLEIAYVRKKQNSTSRGKCNRWLVHGNCKFRWGCGFPWARKCGHGCLLVNDTAVIREINFEDMIWYVFGLVPCTTSHWKIVGNESRAKGSMNICQWGPVKGKCGTLYCSCTVAFCMPMIWYSCVCLINSWDEDYIYGTPPPLTVSRSEEWLKGNKKPMQTGDSTMRERWRSLEQRAILSTQPLCSHFEGSRKVYKSGICNCSRYRLGYNQTPTIAESNTVVFMMFCHTWYVLIHSKDISFTKVKMICYTLSKGTLLHINNTRIEVRQMISTFPSM